jgi:hypothetical protein
LISSGCIGRTSVGFQNFDAALFTPQYVKERLVYMTPQWKDAFRYATKLAISWHGRGDCELSRVERNRVARGCLPRKR